MRFVSGGREFDELVPMPETRPTLVGEYDPATRELRVATWVRCPLCGRVEPTSACPTEHSGGPGRVMVFRFDREEDP